MMDKALLLIGIIGFLDIVFLPGAWITFGLPLPGLPFWVKLFTGAVLSPLAVSLQFYLVRVLGVPFKFTVLLLVILNLPVLYLIFKHLKGVSLPARRKIVATLLTLLIPLACFAPQLILTQARLYSGHAWMHGDIVYSIANGNLLLEEPDLAGVSLAYPWAGHVYQAVLSYLIGSPPVVNYIWTNLLWLLLIFGFVAGLVDVLGGNFLSKLASIIWLSFGVNFVGYILQQVLPQAVVTARPMWGDFRYSPWLAYFYFFHQIVIGLGIFAAIAYFVIRRWPDVLNISSLAVLCLLICSLGIIYPILFPVGCALVGAKIIAMLLDKLGSGQALPYKQSVAVGITLFIAGLATVVHFKFINQSRVTRGVYISNLYDLKYKVIESVIVTMPLLLGLCLVIFRHWKRWKINEVQQSAAFVLGLVALVSFALHAVLDIPYWRNEYKFIFTVAICLAPFPGLALEPLFNRLGKWAGVAFAAFALVLAAPFIHKLVNQRQWWDTTAFPVTDVRSFDLRLESSNNFSGVLDAIRQLTPVNTILAVESAEFNYPTLSRRQLYGPPVQEKQFPGINLTSDHVLKNVKGYDPRIIEDRKLTLKGLFDANDAIRREQSLNQILKLDRPLAIVLREERNATVLEWLASTGKGRRLYKDNGLVLWLVEPVDQIAGH